MNQDIQLHKIAVEEKPILANLMEYTNGKYEERYDQRRRSVQEFYTEK